MTDEKKLALVDSKKCDDCGGTGYQIEDDDDGDGGTRAVRCRCRAEAKRDPLIAAGLGKLERSFTAQGLNACQRRIIEDARAALSAGHSIMLRGEVGQGKTGIAVVLAREAIAAGKKAAWCHVETWLRQIKLSFDEASHPDSGKILDEESLTQPLIEADLLVIDDLGAEYLTPWTRSMIYSLVNNRDREDGQTICTTNLPLRGDSGDSITSVYGDRVASRLSRYRRISLPVDAPDRRGER